MHSHVRATIRRSTGLSRPLLVGTVAAALAACSGAPVQSTPTATTATSATAAAGVGASTGASVTASPALDLPSATSGTAAACPLDGTSTAAGPLVPATGTWLGMSLDWANDNVAAVRDRVGADRTPAVWVQFASFPITAADEGNLDGLVKQVRSVGGIALITLEPNDGLAKVNAASANAAAVLFAGYRACGVPLLVRFAQEMNGSWYAWGQDPTAYVAAFRTLAAAIHEHAPGVATLWAPNSALGYPFLGGAHGAGKGSAAAAALDTDGDGALTGGDDPYAPYWPGDDAVDWVGMSAYHFGNTYPWGANVVPRAGAFAALLTGGVRGFDFYGTWAVGHRKPMAIVETAALWRPTGGGASARAIKQAWWRQVFSTATRDDLPAIRLIGWFEWRKHEAEVDDVVDWRLTADPRLVDAFAADLPPDWLRFAPRP